METTITTDSLRELNACADQVELFGKLYPEGLELPEPGTDRDVILNKVAKYGFDVHWWLQAAHETGTLRLWHNDGIRAVDLHYIDGLLNDVGDVPAVRRWGSNVGLITERHCVQNQIIVERDKDGNVGLIAERRCTQGRPNDADCGPAVRRWENGVVTTEECYVNGQQSRWDVMD